MRRILLLLFLFIGWASAPGGLAAQGFLDKTLENLRGMTGKEGGSARNLSSDQIAAGLREALKVGTARVVDTLGASGGFLDRPDVHIPLPKTLQRAQSLLERAGMGGLGQELETRLNRAAEAAVPKGKALFLDAISKMTLDDARAILNGPKDAATRYFQSKMSTPLADAMRPVVDTELKSVGAVSTYERMTAQYRTLPFVPNVRADLTGYVLDKAIAGVFLYLAREEAAIRENPAKRTTELLKTVFGAK